MQYRLRTKLIACFISTALTIGIVVPSYSWIVDRQSVVVTPVSRAELVAKLAKDPRAALYCLSDNDKILFEHRQKAVATFNSRETFEGRTQGWTATTDSNGLRNNSPAIRPTARKIIMLGDSTTFGVGLNDAETIPSCLTRILSDQSGEAIDCLNFGVSSYTTVQEVAYFKHKQAMQFHPEVVVVGFCVNDYAEGIGSLGVVEGQIQLLRPELAAKLNLGAAKVRRSKPVNPRTWKMGPPRQETIDAVYTALDRLRRELQGRPMIVVLFPRSFQLSGPSIADVDDRQRPLRHYCQRHGITCVDLLDHFHGCDPLEFYRPGDGLHPNPEAAARIAEILSRPIAQHLGRTQQIAATSASP